MIRVRCRLELNEVFMAMRVHVTNAYSRVSINLAFNMRTIRVYSGRDIRHTVQLSFQPTVSALTTRPPDNKNCIVCLHL